MNKKKRFAIINGIYSLKFLIPGSAAGCFIKTANTAPSLILIFDTA